jgi:hypothetical protein
VRSLRRRFLEVAGVADGKDYDVDGHSGRVFKGEKMKYAYYVTWDLQSDGGGFYPGSGTVVLPVSEVRSFQDVKLIVLQVAAATKTVAEYIVIRSWQRLPGDDTEDTNKIREFKKR